MYISATSPLLSYSNLVWYHRNWEISLSVWWHYQDHTACTAAQENTGQLIENVISQALTKPQDVMPPNPTIDCRTLGTNHTSNSSYETNWTSSWPTTNFGIPQQSYNDRYHSQRPYETPTYPNDYVNQQPPPTRPHSTSVNLVKLFRWQTELTEILKLQMHWIYC